MSGPAGQFIFSPKTLSKKRLSRQKKEKKNNKSFTFCKFSHIFVK